MFRKLTTLGAAFAIAVTMIFTGVGTATASEGPPPGNEPELVPISEITGEQGMAPLAITAPPGITCYGQTDQPHPSGHVSGTVNSVARTVCPATNYVEVQQYRSRWYGWQKWGNKGTNTSYGTAQANSADVCAIGDEYTYLAESYHTAAGYGYAYTSNSKRFICL